MKDNKSSLISFFLCIVLAVLIGYLTFFVNTGYKKPVPEEITVEGNNLLSGEDYLMFTKLEPGIDYGKYSEAVIKDRFEKHPYVLRADVETVGKNKIKVNAVEKDIKAVIILNSEPYLISSDFQMLPVFTNINQLDVPVITNFKTSDKVKVLSFYKNENIVNAFRIIDALKGLNNTELIENLSEINLNSAAGLTYAGDIVINFSGFNPSIIFGRGDEARKAVCLESLWKSISNGEFNGGNSDYVDIRFANNIYFGSMNNTGGIQ